MGFWMWQIDLKEGKDRQKSKKENTDSAFMAWTLSGLAMLGIWLIKNG
jgi:hypothetical protein